MTDLSSASIPTVAPAPRDRRHAAFISIALLAMTLVAFGSVARCGFVNFDDNLYVTANPHVQRGLTWEGVTWAFGGARVANYHPLTWLSLMLDRQLWGAAPAGFHLTNLALHGVNVLLLFATLRAMTGATWRSGLVAALFALHPLRVESVAWVSSRKDVLSAFFGLLALAAYVRYVRHDRRGWYAATACLFAASLLSKPTFVTLPALLLLLDAWPLRRQRTWRQLLLEKLPLLAIALLAAGVTYAAQSAGGTIGSIERYTLLDRLANAAVAYVRYVGMLLWPRDLAVFYPHARAWAVGTAVGALAVLSIVTTLVLHRRRQQPALAVGWFWYLGTLVPMIGLVQVGGQSIADRYTYLPMIGLLIAIVWALPRSLFGTARGRMALGSVAAVVLVALGVATHRQVGHWQDSESLWRHALAVTRHNHVAHTNLAVDLTHRGQTGEAWRQFEAALLIRPTYSVAHNGLGALKASAGDLAGATAHYRAAVKSNPSYAVAHRNLAGLLSACGQADEAIAHFRQAAKLRPRDASTHALLGIELAKRGRVGEAVTAFEAAVQADPHDANAHLNFGRALLETGWSARAIEHLERALQLRPTLAEAHYHLGVVLARRGDLCAAADRFRLALSIDPADSDAQAALEQVLAAVE